MVRCWHHFCCYEKEVSTPVRFYVQLPVQGLPAELALVRSDLCAYKAFESSLLPLLVSKIPVQVCKISSKDASSQSMSCCRTMISIEQSRI